MNIWFALFFLLSLTLLLSKVGADPSTVTELESQVADLEAELSTCKAEYASYYFNLRSAQIECSNDFFETCEGDKKNYQPMPLALYLFRIATSKHIPNSNPLLLSCSIFY